MSVLVARMTGALVRPLAAAAQPRLGRVLTRVVVGLLLAATPAQGQMLADRATPPIAVGTGAESIRQDTRFPLISGIHYALPNAEISIGAGAAFGSTLRIEDNHGQSLAEHSQDPAPIPTLTFRISF